MKKLFFILIFIFISLFTVNYKYSEFDLTSSSSLSTETTKISENYYLGYGLQWNGFIKPTMESIELRDADGLVLDKNHDLVEVTIFMDMLQHTGTLNETAFLEYSEKGNLNYVEVSDAKIENANTLVLRINLKDERYLNMGSTITLRYHILGIPKRQSIELNGFLE